MPGWLKIVIAAASGFGTGASSAAATGANTKAAVITGIVGAVTAVATLHVDPPNKVSIPK